jgi:hypothetical protein
MAQTLRDYRRLFRTFINRAQADSNFASEADLRTDVLGHLIDAAVFLDNFTTLLMLGEKKRNDAHDFIDLLRHGLKLDGRHGSMLTRSADPGTESEALWSEDSAEFLNAALNYLEVGGKRVRPGDMIVAADEDDGVQTRAAVDPLSGYDPDEDSDSDFPPQATKTANAQSREDVRVYTGNDLIGILQVLASQGRKKSK